MKICLASTKMNKFPNSYIMYSNTCNYIAQLNIQVISFSSTELFVILISMWDDVLSLPNSLQTKFLFHILIYSGLIQ